MCVFDGERREKRLLAPAAEAFARPEPRIAFLNHIETCPVLEVYPLDHKLPPVNI
jgi:hypothetical protein